MRLGKMLSWAKVLFGFFSLQLVVQGISAAIGIIIVRVVTKQQYAYYTIANAFLASASNLADCGITIALTSIGGRLWEDRRAFSRLLTTAFAIRGWFTVVVFIFVLSSFPVMLFRNGAPASVTASVTAILLVSILLQFGAGIYVVVPQLRADYKLLQKVVFQTALLRAVLLGIAWVTVLNATTVVLMNAIAFGFVLYSYRSYVKKEVDLEEPPDKGFRTEILRIIGKQVPYEVYGVFSGQISVFLLSIFGSSSKVADVGALSRIAVIFTAMSSVLTNILIPKFAKSRNASELPALYWKILLSYAAGVTSIFAIVALFRDQVIGILGKQYSDLGPECLLAVGVAVVGALLGAVWSINSSRGWIVPAWIGLSVGLGAQVLGITLFNIRTVHGVLVMNLATNCAGLIANLVASFIFLRRAQDVVSGPIQAV